MSAWSPTQQSGERIGIAHVIPRSRRRCASARSALERLARYSMGALGRTPDYVNVTTAGFAGRPDVFGMNGDTRAVEALQRFQREVALRDLALTHTIVHPVVDKSVGDVGGLNGELALRIVCRTTTASSCAARACSRRSARSPTSCSSIRASRCPKDATRATRSRSRCRWRRKGLITICRDHYGKRGRRRRPPVLEPLRRAGRVHRSSTTSKCRGSACSSTATSRSTTRS